MRLRFRPYLVLTLVLFAGSALLPLSAAAQTPAGPDEPAKDDASSELVAYYFHGTKRCATCRKLEAYSEEAITKGFAEELASGQLAWRVVNTDEKKNKHFVEDFQLVTKSVVLVEYNKGKIKRFENLARVWQLVGNKGGFLEYVREATRDFLESN